ncbi:MAG: UDP-N-acetylglucosamine 1-carboxyvinyltransferase, partial [Patescibacteria group bacterium]
MAEFHIVGKTPLQGEIPVRGAKNSALKAIAAAPLFSRPFLIKNVPAIEDVSRMTDLLEDLGAETARKGERELLLDSSNIKGTELKKEIAERLRASIVLTGPLLARQKKVSSPYPGGCVIGKRPIDIFIEGFKALGAKVKASEHGFEARAARLAGARFTFKKISVTATETLMMTASLAHGKTVLLNAALEPEIPHLAEFLNASGAHIKGAGTPTIEITGTGGNLLTPKAPFVTIPDRVEAGSFLALGALLGNPLTITDCNPSHLEVPIALLEAVGVNILRGENSLTVRHP